MTAHVFFLLIHDFPVITEQHHLVQILDVLCVAFHHVRKQKTLGCCTQWVELGDGRMSFDSRNTTSTTFP